MPLILVDDQIIDMEEGCLIYCSPAEGMPNKGQAICWSWSEVSPELKLSFLKLRRQWSTMLRAFMLENREALGRLGSPPTVELEDGDWF